MPLPTDSSLDNRLQRGLQTRRLLMRAAEKLIADKGLGHVSIREILDEAGQSNTSALQYHFGNLKGLITAILDERAEATRMKRAELMEALLSDNNELDLHSLCELMIRPSFELARADVGYRRYIKAFSHHLTLIEDSAAEKAFSGGGGGKSGIELARLLKQKLPHLDDKTFRQRMDFSVRLCASAMSTQARVKNAFRGSQSNLFIEDLIDAVVGLLTGPVRAR